MDIIIPIVAFGIIGLIMGVVLGIASKLFAVETDPRIEKVSECLSGANCGGCGFAGCSACAEAIVSGNAKIDACPSMSNENIATVAKIMGVEAVEKEPMTAFVHCGGSIDKVNYKYYFDGTKSCRDVASLNGGDKACEFACLGYGDCVLKCNFNAISVKDNVASVNPDNCTACGQCIKECPRGVISLVPMDAKVKVQCSSKDKGVAVKDKCSVGCIACRLCEKNCPTEAVKVVDNLAVIDYEKCIKCGLCAEKCPKKLIRL